MKQQMEMADLHKSCTENDFPTEKYQTGKLLSECTESFVKAGPSMPADMMWTKPRSARTMRVDEDGLCKVMQNPSTSMKAVSHGLGMRQSFV